MTISKHFWSSSRQCSRAFYIYYHTDTGASICKSRICVYGTPTIACGKTTNTIEKAGIVFNSAAMAYDEPIEDFEATVPEIEDGVLESEEPNAEEEVMDENDAGDNNEQDMGGDLEDGTAVEVEIEEMTDETVSGNNADM